MQDRRTADTFGASNRNTTRGGGAADPSITMLQTRHGSAMGVLFRRAVNRVIAGEKKMVLSKVATQADDQNHRHASASERLAALDTISASMNKDPQKHLDAAQQHAAAELMQLVRRGISDDDINRVVLPNRTAGNNFQSDSLIEITNNAWSPLAGSWETGAENVASTSTEHRGNVAFIVGDGIMSAVEQNVLGVKRQTDQLMVKSKVNDSKKILRFHILHLFHAF